jgi:hypothetical protein
MELAMMEIIKMGKKMELGNLSGLMVQNTLEIFLRITSMERDSILGLIKEFIMENGNLTKWKDMGNLYGLMEGNIKENTKMIRKRVLVILNGNI